MTIASSKVVPPACVTPPHNGFSLISNDKLLQIYSTMLKCRMLQARIRSFANGNNSIRPASKMSPVCAMSQEALAAGVGLDLLPGDTLAPSPGGFIPCFVKGLPLETIFERVFSVHSPVSAAARPRYTDLNLIPPSLNLAVQLERVIRDATAHKKSRNKKIAVALCGDSSASRGILIEVMRQAGKRNLPILLICHSGKSANEICPQAQAFGFPGVIVDGDDAVAVYRVATEAIAHARRGSGPTLIECRPWVLSGDESRSRPAAGNPILKMENYLTRKGLFDKKFKSSVTAAFRRELEDAMNFARSSEPTRSL
jgi:pyruvate dehydrogenase E1 component alpha subunit